MLPITETSLLHGTTAVRGGGGMISISLSGLSLVGVSGGGFFYVMGIPVEAVGAFKLCRCPAVWKRLAISFTTDRLDYSFSISDLESPVIRQISAGG